MAARTLVTGASGFVGAAVLRALVDRGEAVRALVRASSPRANLEGVDCEIVVGDMRDSASMASAMEGVSRALPCGRRLPALGAQSRTTSSSPTARARGW